MSTEPDEPFFDPVTICVIELTAAAKPKDPAAWLALLQRFTETVLREAFEHQDEIRERLGVERPRVNADGERACPYCGDVVETMVGHRCQRMRELGFGGDVKPQQRDDKPTEPRSTGAAAAEPTAEQPPAKDAASETPAAPSTPVLPAAERIAAVPSQEGAGSSTGGADSKPLRELEATRDAQPIAEPASPSKAEGATSAAALSGGDAGAPPAGPAPGAEASQPRKRRGPAPALDDAQCRKLHAEHEAAIAANGGRAPYGWIKAKCNQLGVGEKTLWRALDRALELREQPINGYAAAPPEKPRPAPPAAAREAASAPRAHTNSHSCWCRQSPCNTKNPWCKLAKPSGPIPNLAGLSDPPRRVDRYFRRA